MAAQRFNQRRETWNWLEWMMEALHFLPLMRQLCHLHWSYSGYIRPDKPNRLSTPTPTPAAGQFTRGYVNAPAPIPPASGGASTTNKAWRDAAVACNNPLVTVRGSA